MALPAFDDFNRADGPVGANWTNLTDSFEITSNAVHSTTNAVFASAVWNADVVSVNHYSQLTIGNHPAPVPAVRVASGGNLYMFRADSPETFALEKVVASLGFLLQQFHVIPVDGDIMRATIDGAVLKCFVNGVQLGTDHSDSTFTTGAPGMRAFENTNTSDDFECGEWPLVPIEQDLMSIRQRMI